MVGTGGVGKTFDWGDTVIIKYRTYRVGMAQTETLGGGYVTGASGASPFPTPICTHSLQCPILMSLLNKTACYLLHNRCACLTVLPGLAFRGVFFQAQ